MGEPSHPGAGAGDKVVVVIHPLENGANGGSLVKVTVNGTTLD
jgi:hypothetical protein